MVVRDGIAIGGDNKPRPLRLGEVRLNVMIGRRSFLAEMFKEALERIARRDMRYFQLVARIGRFGGLHLDGHDRAAHFVDHVGESDRRNDGRHLALKRGGRRLTETAIVHASHG